MEDLFLVWWVVGVLIGALIGIWLAHKTMDMHGNLKWPWK